MFIKFNEQGYETSDENGDEVEYDAQTVSTPVFVKDPWGTPYGYSYDPTTKSFIVYSVGTFELGSGEEMSAGFVSGEWKFSKTGDPVLDSMNDPERDGIISSHWK